MAINKKKPKPTTRLKKIDREKIIPSKPSTPPPSDGVLLLGALSLLAAGFIVGEFKGSPTIIQKIVKFPYPDNTII